MIVHDRSHLRDHRCRGCAQRSAPRRRARSRARHGVRDRHARARRSGDPCQAVSRRATHGIRPSRLPGPRPARGRAGQSGRAVLRARRRSTPLRSRRRVEATALRLLRERKPDRRRDTNVEFYTALLLHGLDLPPAFFTPTFAVGRVVGWSAHCLEQLRDGRLIRPQSTYIGPSGLDYARREVATTNFRFFQVSTSGC